MLRTLFGRVSVFLICVVAIMGAMVIGLVMATVEIFAPPHYTVILDDVPVLSASSWAVFDVETGEILSSVSANQVLPIASITKLVAGAALYEQHDLFESVEVTWGDTFAEGRAGSLQGGQTYSRYTLLFPLLLESSNDAAATFTRTIPSLVDDMNSYATSLGLLNTTFRDASGLSDGNRSTAADLVRVMHDIYTTKRHLIDMTGVTFRLLEENGWRNNSPFIDSDTYVGGKHGFTPGAGHTAVAVFAERFSTETRPIGYVLLGSMALSPDLEKLQEYVQKNIRFE